MSDDVLAIDVRSLEVRYGATHAVRGVDLAVRRGEVFALLGPNGAGKTSTLEVLEGFRRRSSGSVNVLGTDPTRAKRSWRSQIGFMLQESEPDADLSAAEVLTQFAGYYPNPRPVDELLDMVGLRELAHRRCSKLSGGEQRRLELALALVGSPELVFLDEPTTGFDPAARRRAWETIASLAADGITVLLTTHQMDEAHYLADTIAVIASGKIVAQGTTADLAAAAALLPTVSWHATDGVVDVEGVALGGLQTDPTQPVGDGHAVRDTTTVGPRWSVTTGEVERVMRALLARPDAAELLATVEVRQPTLEDAYLALVGHEPSQASEAASAPSAVARRGAESQRHSRA